MDRISCGDRIWDNGAGAYIKTNLEGRQREREYQNRIEQLQRSIEQFEEIFRRGQRIKKTKN